MGKQTIKTIDKMLSVFLSLLMLVSVIPTTVFASTANNPSAFTFTVKDSDDSSNIDGANIKYEIFVDSVSVFNKDTGITTTDGEAVVAEMSGYETDISAGKNVEISYTVSKDGYDSKTATATVNDVEANIDVLLEKTVPVSGTANVTVSKSGNGKVEINSVETANISLDKNESVNVTVTPDDGWRIKSVKIGDESKTVSNDKQAFNTSFTLLEDVAISVEFVKYYKITVSDYENGQITVNGNAAKEQFFDEGSSVSLSVSANNDANGKFQIESLLIDGVEQTDTVKTSTFSKSLTVNDNIVISAEFVQIFTVTAVYNSANGSVKIDSSPVDSGDIIVKKINDTIAFNANPAENFRVSQVDITNGKSETVKSLTFTDNNKDYSDTLQANQDYVITITFAKNTFNINLTSDSNGKVSFGTDFDNPETSKVFEYEDAAPVFYVYTNPGYNIKDVTATGYEFDSQEYDNTVGGYKVKFIGDVKVTSEINIHVSYEENNDIISFKENVKVKITNGPISVEFNNGDNELESFSDLTAENTSGLLVKKSGNTLVFKPNTKIELTNKNNRNIELQFEFIDNAAYKLNGMGWYDPGDDTAIISANAALVNVQVKKRVNYSTKDFNTINSQLDESGDEIDPKDYPLKYYFIFDDVAPSKVSVVTDNSNYYTDSFDIIINSEEKTYAYNGITVSESYSGISKVEYTVKNGTAVLQQDTVSIDGMPQKFENFNLFTVSTSEINYSEEIVVAIKVYDAAGNTSQEVTKTFKVCTVKPEITVTTDSEGNKYNNNIWRENPYFTQRVAVIRFAETDINAFNENKAKEAVTITVDGEAKTLNDIDINRVNYAFSNDGNTKVLTITFAKDGRYSVSVDDSVYENKAGLKDDNGIEIVDTDLDDFYIDNTAPVAGITALNSVWSELLKTITFGLFSNSTITVIVENESDSNGIAYVGYVKVDEATAAIIANDANSNSVAKLSGLSFAENAVSVSSDEAFVVYAKIVDIAGNITYIGTDGLIYDGTVGTIDITPTASANDNGYYSSNVTLNVTVNENTSSAYSGIKSVDYEITAEGCETESKKVFPVGTGEIESIESSVKCKVVVNAGKFNAESVKVKITATDNAGNSWENIYFLKINSTTPTIDVAFNTDEPYSVDGGRGYFGAARTAVVTINDRADTFNRDNVVITINAKDAKSVDVDSAYEIIWNNQKATINFNKDANYDWSIAYTNKAGKSVESNGITTDGDNPFVFTVDTVIAEGSVNVNNNIWKTLLNMLTFGLFSKEKATVSLENIVDLTSPIKEIKYYKSNSQSYEDPETINYNNDCTPNPKGSSIDKIEISTINPNELFVYYFRITDMAGNVAYLCSDGYIVDNKACEIVLTPVNSENENGIYNMSDAQKGNGFINVAVKVTDKIEDNSNENSYAGIKSIRYKIIDNISNVTEEKTLYSFDYTRDSSDNRENDNLVISDWASGTEVVTNEKYPTQAMLKHEWEGNISVDAQKFNSSDVTLTVYVEDNAGNTSESSKELSIDNTAPVINVSYVSENRNGSVYADNGYYTARTATIKITEREDNFDADLATKGIEITETDAKDNAVSGTYEISNWTTETGTTPDEAVHTATIKYLGDANYKFDIKYTDNANNTNTSVQYSDVNSAYNTSFTVDNTAPTGSITATSKDESAKTETREDLNGDLTFGFWSINGIAISATNDDITSPIYSVKYYMPVAVEEANENTSALNAEKLDAVSESEWNDFGDGFDVSANKQFTVYLRITDNAGNYTYMRTNGLIVDDQHPDIESVAPEITVTPEQPINGIYNSDVKVAIKVVDPLTSGTYSGLKEIKYEVYDRQSKTPDKPTQSGVLYAFDTENPTQDQLQQLWEGEITVDSSLNNSNDIQIIVYAIDNAGNSSDNSQVDSKSYTSIMIDVTAPIIDIEYNNNIVDSNSYFKADRTATIKITERNFNSDDVVIKITNTDGTIPSLVGWNDVDGTYNQDDSIHTATITYASDGDYTFEIAYTDLAGNECTSIEYAEGTMAPTAFTIDKTSPIVSVTYDNNAALNGNYYNSVRTATIVINEHNFSTDRIHISIIATDDGANTTVPGVGAWSTNGNTHVATIYYPGDAMYTFDIEYTDLAGNVIADYTPDIFYIDKTAPEIVIGNVENNKPYPDNIAPTVTYSDTNYDPSQVTITLSGANRGNNLELKGGYSDIHNGRVFSFADFERIQSVDDIYTLSATVTDKAGNTTTQQVVFSVNRFGSVYSLSDDTERVVNTYISNPIDIVVYETNTNSLSEIKITLFKNGTDTIVLEEGKDYQINVSGGNGSWYRYTYTVFKNNFVNDGTYVLTFHSKDQAGNIAENTLDTKNLNVSFGTDKTLPTINAKNLENGKTYPVESMTVKIATSDNLLLSSVVVYLDGKEYKSWSGDELKAIIESGKDFEFDISGDTTSAHNVKVVAVDAAGHEQVLEINDFYVTTNLWVRYFNNKPLFFGSIGGVIMAAALIIFLIVYKRRKKENEEK